MPDPNGSARRSIRPACGSRAATRYADRMTGRRRARSPWWIDRRQGSSTCWMLLPRQASRLRVHARCVSAAAKNHGTGSEVVEQSVLRLLQVVGERDARFVVVAAVDQLE